MHVLMINGSPRPKGNTAFALDTVARALEEQGITTAGIDIGGQVIRGCTSCWSCMKKQNQKCRFEDDSVNEILARMVEADGFVIGSPVYYAGINGTLKSFLDRAFFVASVNGGLFRHKVGAAVTAVRRGGAVPAFEQINKYFSIAEMFMPAGTYWNMVYGMMPGEAAQDEEGVQCMRVLGANMGWLLRLMEYGKGAVPPPAAEPRAMTNFIR